MQPLARIALGEVRLEGAATASGREADGRLQLQRLFAAEAPAVAASAPASAPASGPAALAWQAAIDRPAIEDARLLWNDAATAGGRASQLDAVKL